MWYPPIVDLPGGTEDRGNERAMRSKNLGPQSRTWWWWGQCDFRAAIPRPEYVLDHKASGIVSLAGNCCGNISIRGQNGPNRRNGEHMGLKRPPTFPANRGCLSTNGLNPKLPHRAAIHNNLSQGRRGSRDSEWFIIEGDEI